MDQHGTPPGKERPKLASLPGTFRFHQQPRTLPQPHQVIEALETWIQRGNHGTNFSEYDEETSTQ